MVMFTTGGSTGLRKSVVPCVLVPLLIFASTANSAPPPPGVAPVIPPTGGFAIDGDLLANRPAANMGDWLYTTNGMSGSGRGVLSNAGVPLNDLATFHFIDAYGSDDLSNGYHVVEVAPSQPPKFYRLSKKTL